jgi:hypothetical protein
MHSKTSGRPRDNYNKNEEELDDEVRQLLDDGCSEDEIISRLRAEGYSISEIKESINYLK